MDDFDFADTKASHEKLKRIAGLVFLIICIICFAFSTVTYCIKENKKNANTEVFLPESEQVTDVKSQSFIDKLCALNSELKIRQISYNSYVLYAGKNIGDATITVSDNSYQSAVTLKCEHITSEIDFSQENSSPIGTYIDTKQKELITDKANEITSIIRKMLFAMTDYSVKSADAQKITEYIIKATKSGDEYNFTVNKVNINLCLNRENGSITIKLIKE